jgi:glucose-6-phosphate 1-dehydrogenase
MSKILTSVVIFGASGDLTRCKLTPALYICIQPDEGIKLSAADC